jgi:hypothetical protein
VATFTVILDCSAPAALTADTILGLAAQRVTVFDVILRFASSELLERAQRLDLVMSERVTGEYVCELTGFDVPLAHWLQTFAGLAGHRITTLSAAAAIAPIGWSRWRNQLGFRQTGPVDIAAGETTLATHSADVNGTVAATQAVTVLRRIPTEPAT